MKLIVQPVCQASVFVAEKDYKQSINKGLLVYVGISKTDIEDYQNKLIKITKKIGDLKLFDDKNGSITKSLKDISGEILLIPNFTIYGENNKGTKINFSKSAGFKDAELIYGKLFEELSLKFNVKNGIFGGKMEIKSTNIGPLNFIFEF